MLCPISSAGSCRSRPGRADSGSGSVRIGQLATDFCDAIKNRDVPRGDSRETKAAN
jgi:hypothetical protein